MTVLRLTDKRMTRTYDIHPDGRKFGSFKDMRFDFAIVENAAETESHIIRPGDNDYNVTLVAADETGDVQFIGYMDEIACGLWNKIAWWDLFVWEEVIASKTQMDLDLISNPEQIIAIKYQLFAHEIPLLEADTIANEFITNGNKTHFRSLSLTDAPTMYKRIIEGNI